MTDSPEFDNNSTDAQVKLLQQTNELLTHLLVGSGHETRALVGLITGYSTLLLEEEFGALTEDQAQAMGQVRKYALKLSHVFDYLSTISRVVLLPHRKKGELEEVDLRQLVEELDSIEIDRITLEEEVPPIRFDERLLSSILELLLSVPAPDFKRNITLEAKRENKFVTVHIGIKSSEGFWVSNDDPRLLSCQIGIEQQGGYLNWEQPEQDKLNMQVGLPVYEDARPSA